ncbi:MAG TPA: bifunctional DNA-formamidopyrimidine glycosylase/DNA-(apurinic or apyrimidinic site) lyase [Steroidobacteraceae bacterium]|nr:bifunctional DNA-formamidopyrimidine glycosylase/DNA-(apurinic or apyrimidinic site) lyase [Steroidobacteraceae bacterium]HQX46934.1 bifunctional DNA-formamidopyrimidine glycosylase/DNA-(apurinic or apyrimidinic site) lyase [Steroidobacteraceae bacterium]HQX79676.1 bifunctional DNA-formamidopyrimidine glycosylase/DNA-(apurinic or apyrimidinic site) lyase [Steroidobacteraceae bacterium]HQZ80415.1 bifunctional DNA-formamidopyrimidine glycosylase/DNA-(apurinic or apyrimidinic site) lyase [Steroi
MPELPEVETTRRGIEPHVVGHCIRALLVHEPRLRWRVAADLPARVAGQKIRAAGRRAKFLLLELERGTLLLHLGMSGNLRVVPADAPRGKHDHIDLVLDSGELLRFNDPRRFGSLLFTTGDPAVHPLLAALAPEPLGDSFDADYLWRITRQRRVAVKQLIMNSRLVVGVGNIYASEALFRARIRPGREARRLSRPETAHLVRAIRRVLTNAVKAGGTTLRDYVGADGTPGYFRQQLDVYKREGQPCRRCRTPIRRRVQGQRATYWCPECQK